jgi:hypothetical protein
MADRILYRSLIGHQDFLLGPGTDVQTRGTATVNMQKIELEFIFRTVDEIKDLDYTKYMHVALHQVGAVDQYYFDITSEAVPDDVNVLKPNYIHITQPGRYLRLVPYSAPVVFDTIICSASDQVTELTVDLVNPHNTFRASYALDMTNGYIRINVNQAPTGAKLIVDIHMNGTTMFSTLMSIDIGKKTSVTAAIQSVLDITYVPDDAEFEIFCTQAGSTFAGTGLKTGVTGVKVP